MEAAGGVQLEQRRSLAWTMEAEEASFTGFILAPRIELDGAEPEGVIDAWEQQTSWRSVLCLLPEPVTVRVGDEVRLDATVDLGGG